ncbi:MAG: hypothetical protein DWQ47_04000 [Acidobacteria bacterium]|nr:MAG: hypothetical protein DWQ32_07550 [Acidobacteriota bacterium]REK01558.1 MAG: hypothetical protein DWQ38_03985 [Acidobacteriota bacterium]REK14514.1 MAG: hypothetical protein DWQ43_13240 [Acidobacteriota bacterium]REK45229.1 MAG: hypothetical protein DWQ47_04000 [Acidobacteriota bacterium]
MNNTEVSDRDRPPQIVTFPDGRRGTPEGDGFGDGAFVQRSHKSERIDEGATSDYGVKELRIVRGHAVVCVTVERNGVAHEGIGVCRIEEAHPIRTAEDRALDAAAEKFRLGTVRLPLRRELTIVEDRSIETAAPNAASLSDLISPSQIRSVKRLADSLGISADAEADRLFGCLLGELSRNAADHLIEHLESPASESYRLCLAV